MAAETFAQLKPLCVDVLRSLSTESLARLDEALRRLHHLPPPLVQYVLFPLRAAIRRLAGSEKVLLEGILSCLSRVLSLAAPGHLPLPWDIFHELFVFLSLLLDSRMSEGAGFGVATEERTLRALLALQALLVASCESSLLQLYQNLPAVGHCVSVALSSLQSWESRDVRRGALETLLALTGLTQTSVNSFTGHDGDCRDTADSLRSLQAEMGREGGDGMGQVIASFLPGVTLAISKLLTTSTNLGQRVTNLCLVVWTRYVGLAMADRVLVLEEDVESELTKRMMEEGKKKPSNHPTPSSPPTQTPPPSAPHKDLRVERSRQWRVETDCRLGRLAQAMVGVLVTGEGWKRRRGLVLWAHCLLGNCHRSLVATAPVLLEALLSLSHDGYDQVASSAQVALELFSTQHAEEVGGELVSILEERLYSLSTALPRLMRQHDDSRKVSVLQLVTGHLQLLGPHTVTLTHSTSHLSHITLALIQTLELAADSQPFMQEVHTPLGRGSSGDLISGPRGVGEEWWPLSLRYKHFQLPQIETLIQHCCQLLGFHGSLSSILDHLLDAYLSPFTQRRCELLIMIGHVLLGAGGRGCVHSRERPRHAVEMCALVEGVLEVVTGESWGGGEEGEGEAISLQCLQLQVVAVCAHLLRDAVLPHLQTLAYQLLARAGSPRSEVTSRALATLNTVATCTGVSSLPQLITSNADYLVNCVAITLRGHTHKQEALQVLQAVLDHGVEEVLPLMRDSIDELLLCLDLQLVDNERVWSVLRSLAAALHRWHPHRVEKEGGEGGGCLGENEEEPVDVVRYFSEYRRHGNNHSPWDAASQSSQEAANQSPREVEEEGEMEVSQPTLTPVEQAVVDVLSRCPHYLPCSPSLPPSVPLLALDCLSHCLHALKHNQLALLPQVHKVWPSFILRLSDHTPLIALRTLEVLWDMCEVCGDFVRRRCVKGVWPVIAQSLTTLAVGSVEADRSYRHTAAYKLQRQMLQTVGVLPLRLQVAASDLETLVHASIPYLNSKQPHPLVETCKTSLTALFRADPDLMWLLLHQLVPMATTSPPHPSLHPYKFPRLADSSETFTETASSLLELLSSL